MWLLLWSSEKKPEIHARSIFLPVYFAPLESPLANAHCIREKNRTQSPMQSALGAIFPLAQACVYKSFALLAHLPKPTPLIHEAGGSAKIACSLFLSLSLLSLCLFLPFVFGFLHSIIFGSPICYSNKKGPRMLDKQKQCGPLYLLYMKPF